MNDELEGKLKAAIIAADFNTAQDLVISYSEEIVRRVTAAATPLERARLIGSFRDVLSLARVTRAHLAGKLASVTARSRYRTIVPERHTFQIEA